MDSLTQATLGAAVGYACWRRPLGRVAVGWGVAWGTLPDLDVVVFPWLDDVQRLYWHRGESHAWWFVLVASAAIGWLMRRVHAERGLTRMRATVGAALVLATHVAIDLFTVYGTQLLAPWSRHGFATANLFIIDPLYTLPLLAGVVLALALRTPGARARANAAGLALSTAYVAWSLVAQARADAVFRRELARQGWAAERGFTAATLFNTVLWRHLAAVEGGFVVGYRSLLDGADEAVEFRFLPQQAALVEPMRGTRAFEVVDWFSQGYWVAEPTPDGVRLSDLRFGELRERPDAPPETWRFLFAWEVPAAGDRLVPLPQDVAGRAETLGAVWRRLRGDRDAW